MVPFKNWCCHLDLVYVLLSNAWVDWSDFLWLIGGDWKKVPFDMFDDQRRHSFKMASQLYYNGTTNRQVQ
jgi:hypothetical protein